jgi:hypothetical protein
MSEEKKSIKGGEFLIKEARIEDIFIAEEWNEEQKMMRDTCYEFLEAEIFPDLDRKKVLCLQNLIKQEN